jgi:hypothetical protein
MPGSVLANVTQRLCTITQEWVAMVVRLMPDNSAGGLDTAIGSHPRCLRDKRGGYLQVQAELHGQCVRLRRLRQMGSGGVFVIRRGNPHNNCMSFRKVRHALVMEFDEPPFLFLLDVIRSYLALSIDTVS